MGIPTIPGPQLSLILFGTNDLALIALLQQAHDVLRSLGASYEILVVTSQVISPVATSGEPLNVKSVPVAAKPYGERLRCALAAAEGQYFLTIDVSLVADLTIIQRLWSCRHQAEIIVASRYAQEINSPSIFSRSWLSWLFNRLVAYGLSLPMHDVSGGIRLYETAILRRRVSDAADYNILLEILVQAFCEGWQIKEVAAQYSVHRNSFAGMLALGRPYLQSFFKLWKLRNSILSADYDSRAYDSRIPLQRYWQHQRFHHVTSLLPANGGPVLDVGCGSSQIIEALPAGSVALDILARKLRYARRFSTQMLQASGFSLPFANGSFNCVICSQVIEHVPKDSGILDELLRVLAPGGRLILGTPDYSHWQWVVTEKLYGWASPGAYADEHISHYTRRELISWFEARGVVVGVVRYILQGELIMTFEKAQ